MNGLNNAHILANNQSEVKPKPPPVLKAYGNFVVMWFNEARKVNMTKAGLMLPEGTQDNYETAVFEVLSVGPLCKSGVQVGDIVTAHPEVRILKYLFNHSRWVYVCCTEDKITGAVDVNSEAWRSAYGDYADPSKV